MLLRCISLAAVAVFVLSLTVPVEAHNQDEQFGGILILENLQPGDIVDPALASSWQQRQKAGILFPRLIRSDLGNGMERSFILRFIPRKAERQLRIELRGRETNPAGRLITALDVGTMLERYLLNNRDGGLWQQALLRIEGAQDFIEGNADSISGIRAMNEFTLVITFQNQRMLPVSIFADSLLSASRDYVGPRYLSTGRGPFFRTEPGLYSANKQYCFGRPFIDSIYLGNQDATIQQQSISINLEQPPQDGQVLQYPGKRCVYLVFNPASPLLKNAGARHAITRLIDADSLVSIFFEERASVLRRLVPDAYIPIEALPGTAAGATTPTAVEPLRIAYPEGDSDLKLVAERLHVDLLVGEVESRLVPYQDSPPEDVDMLIEAALIHERLPGHGIWRLLYRHFNQLNIVQAPWIDEVAWLLEMEKACLEDGRLVPLLMLDHTITVPQQLRGVRFFADGTLDFEDAWIAPARSSQ